MEYKKLPKTINEQIELLKERGLIIEDYNGLANPDKPIR